MSKAKVVLRFDVFPEEKERLETICDALGVSKIEFLRRSMKIADSDITWLNMFPEKEEHK